MRLTPELVDRTLDPDARTSTATFMKGRRAATEADFHDMAQQLLNDAPDPQDIWVFTYGSLIWRPEFEFSGKRTAIAHGWHRSFCLQGDTWFRGSLDHPGLMLALDRGGSCAGLAYRLPPDAVEKNLAAVMAREVLAIPHPFPPRWIDIEMDGATVRAITFVIDRNSGNYAGHLTQDQVADVLALAAGSYGSMAQYLRNTVEGLEQLGIHDQQLWTLQELVADRIEAMPPRRPRSIWRRLQTFLRRLRP
jgi:cation transport protein ChaC